MIAVDFYILPDGEIMEYDERPEYTMKKVSEIPECEFAQYMNELLEQLNLCWSIIRNREAKQP